MSSPRFASLVFVMAFGFGPPLWAGNSSARSLLPPLRSAPTDAARVASPAQGSRVIAAARARLEEAGGDLAIPRPVAAAAERPSYGSLAREVRSRLPDGDPILMDPATFEKMSQLPPRAPPGVPGGSGVPAGAPRITFMGDTALVELGGKGGTEIIRVELPPAGVDAARWRPSLENAVRRLPGLFEALPDRVDKIIWTEGNFAAKIRERVVSLVPPEHTERDGDGDRGHVAAR